MERQSSLICSYHIKGWHITLITYIPSAYVCSQNILVWLQIIFVWLKHIACFSPICHGSGSYKCSITEKFSGNFFQFLVTREKKFLGGNICYHAGLSVRPTFRLSRDFSTNLLTPSFSIPKTEFHGCRLFELSFKPWALNSNSC